MRNKVLPLSAFTALGSALFFQTSVHADSIEVKPGDSLWSLSKTYKTTVSNIKLANNLTSDTIYAGQKLHIPVTGKDNASSFKEVLPVQLDNKPASASNNSASAALIEVKPGDSLSMLSKVYKTTISNIKLANNLTSNTIYAGQKLHIPAASETSGDSIKKAVTVQADTTPEVSAGGTNPDIHTYKVKSGDSLWKVSLRFNMKLDDLKEINGLSTNVIYANQVLKVKVTKTQTGTDTEYREQVSPPLSTSLINEDLNLYQLVTDAQSLVGTPYKWGGTTPEGFDCSGFIYFVVNKQVPVKRQTTADYWAKSVSVSEPQPGDFVFFSTYKPGPSHMGIYIGDGKFIHAGSSNGVTVSQLSNNYWKERYLGVKRLAQIW